ncbi:MAG: membrane protein insertase YidC, partial [Gammaproteobacteria bacterium]
MDNLRIFLWVGLGLMLWLSYDAWQRQFPPEPAPVQAQAAADPAASAPEVPGNLPGVPDLPELPESQAGSDPATDVPGLPAEQAASSKQDIVTVRTDVLEVSISLRGGEIVTAQLLDYPLKKDQPDVPVSLLSGDPADFYVVRSGLRAGGGKPEANHQAMFTAEASQFALGDAQEELVVPLIWVGEGGIRVQKNFRFRPGQYAIELEQIVMNDGQEPYQAVGYLQIQRVHRPPERSMFDVDSYSFVGPVLYDGDSYQKLEADDLAKEPVSLQVTNGWIASIQHHFLAAAVPSTGEVENYTATYDGNSTFVSVVDTAFTTVQPGQSASFDSTLFIGPKLQSQMREISDTLTLTVDYGMLTILAQPLFWLLEKIFGFVGNWGWTIIIV